MRKTDAQMMPLNVSIPICNVFAIRNYVSGMMQVQLLAGSGKQIGKYRVFASQTCFQFDLDHK